MPESILGTHPRNTAAILFEIEENEKQCKYPVKGEWINKLCNIHVMEYFQGV